MGTKRGRKHSTLQVRQRHEELEGILRTGNWSRRAARQVAERWGITEQQVYRDRETIIRQWAQELQDESPGETTAKLVQEMRAVRSAAAARALSDGDGSMLRSAVALFDLEARLSGVNKPGELTINVNRGSPEAMAREVVELLPHAAAILGIEPQQIIEAAYEEVQPEEEG